MTTDLTIKDKTGQIISICSSKGGVGKTVIATNFAVCLAKKKHKVALIDGSFQFGNIHLLLNMYPIVNIKDLVERIDTIDGTKFTSYMSKHISDVYVLPAPLKPEQADLISAEAIEKMCKLLVKQYDYIVVDVETGLSECSLSFIENSNMIVTVTDLEMSTLKNTKSLISIFNKLGLKDKVKILVNRSNMKSLLKLRDIPEILDERKTLSIPNNFKIVSKSINVGIPFVMQYRKSSITKALYNIVSEIIDELKRGENNESS